MSKADTLRKIERAAANRFGTSNIAEAAIAWWTEGKQLCEENDRLKAELSKQKERADNAEDEATRLIVDAKERDDEMQTRPAVCGPTAEEVRIAARNSCGMLNPEVFHRWYNASVRSAADVEKPLREEIKRLKDELIAAHVSRKRLYDSKAPLITMWAVVQNDT